MSEQRNRQLMDDFLAAQTDDNLDACIEHHLTKLDDNFSFWLLEQIDELCASASGAAERADAIYDRISRLAESGDYRRAEFDETHPENPKEILLALERRVRRGELNLDTAAEIGTQQFAANDEADLIQDWYELEQSIERAPDEATQADHATLAELLYRIGRRFQTTLDIGLEALVRARSAQAMELRRLHEHGQALEIYEQLAAVAAEHNQPGGQYASLMSMGDVYQIQLGPPAHPDHLARAEQYYIRALQVCEQADLHPELRARVLASLGKTLARQGRFEAGIGHMTEALGTMRALDKPPLHDIYDCLRSLAQAYKDAGDFQAASERYREATDAAPNVVERVECLVSLADVLSYLDEAGSGALLEEAAQLADAISDQGEANRLRSSAYASLADYRRRTGDLQGALDAYQVALQAARAQGNERAEARWLSNLGQLYLLLGQRADAEAAFHEAADVHLRLNDNEGGANWFNNMGAMLARGGELQRASDMWANAFVLFYEVQQPAEMGVSALNLSHLYRERGDLERAEKCVQYGLAKAKAAGALRHQSYALAILSDLQLARGDAVDALATNAKAIALAQQIGDPRAEADFTIKRGELLEMQPATRIEAEQEYRRAIDLMEAMRGRFRTTERRAQLQGYSEEVYLKLVALLIAQSDHAGAVAEAFNVAERSRSRTLAELLSRTPIPRPASLPQELAGREMALLGQLRRLEDSEDVGPEPARRHAQLKQELESVWEQIGTIDEACADYVDLRRLPVVTVEEIRELLAT
jgi:tetratricopeptide (TPR) repeat protein